MQVPPPLLSDLQRSRAYDSQSIMGQRATWWWGGTLQEHDADASSVKWYAFFESFPRHATKDAVLRVSLTNGAQAWQVCRTGPELIATGSNGVRDVVCEIRKVLDEEVPGTVVVRTDYRSMNQPTDTALALELSQDCAIIARISVVSQVDVSSISSLIMTYLVELGRECREKETIISQARKDRDELKSAIYRDLETRKQMTKEIADKMRRILTSKRDHA